MRKAGKIIVGFGRLFLEEILNGFKIKLNGVRYCICPGVRFWIHKGGRCDLGRKTWLSENCMIECAGGSLKIGYNNFFNTNCRIVAVQSILIGDNNLFGPNLILVDHDHCYESMDKPICRQGLKAASIKIGSDIWIGGNVTICAGARIEDHIVVAANSVVKGDLTIPGVYAGCPAKLIKKR